MFEHITDATILRDALEQRDISPNAAQDLASLGKIGVVLSHVEQASDCVLGKTKLGGLPDLPADFLWPSRPPLPAPASPTGLWARLAAWLPEGETLKAQRLYRETAQPLTFLCQINLADMAADTGETHDLPTSGMLYFFYDDVERGLGIDPAEANGFKVLFCADGADLQPASQGELSAEPRVYKEVFLAGVHRFEPSELEGIHVQALEISAADKEAYRDFFEDWNDWRIETHMENMGEDAGVHKLCGVPNLIQGAMEQQCALVSQGVNCADDAIWQSRLGQKILAEPNDWVLLLQLGCDAASGMAWGNLGRLYFWIRTEDLQRQRFDKAWLILQSY